MNEVTIKGEVVFVDEVREYGANGFRKHQVVVETGDGKWANPIPVEFIKDTIELSQGLTKRSKSNHRGTSQRSGMAGERRSNQMVYINQRL